MSTSSQVTSPSEDRAPPPSAAMGSHGSISSMTSGFGSTGSTSALVSDVTTSSADSHHQLQRRDSQGQLTTLQSATIQ